MFSAKKGQLTERGAESYFINFIRLFIFVFLFSSRLYFFIPWISLEEIDLPASLQSLRILQALTKGINILSNR